MQEPQETALVRRCQKGDKEAFRTLVELHKRVLFVTAYLMVRDRALAEDAVQEALIKIWKNLPSLRTHTSLKAWLLRIVINEVRQLLRKKQLPTVSLDNYPEPANVPDEMAISLVRQEDHHCLRQALVMLPEAQRETVVLRYFSGLTVAEIAKATSSRQGTVKSRLSRALDRLGDILREMDMGRRSE